MDTKFIDETNNALKEVLNSSTSVRKTLMDSSDKDILEVTEEFDDYVVHIYFNNSEQGSLNESDNRFKHFGGKYSARRDKPHANGKEHLHLYKNKNQLAVMNVDGTGSHGSSGFHLPNQVKKGIKSLYPDITIPPNGIIESLKLAQRLNLLIEGFPVK